ncbi:hypothetical protein I5677_12615 [Mobilitalea sibirica]|uniref:Uncharacterized protein n=1 Tax=Mobilitalea sibirica TaxID=1462919 RepID=A0A8J7HD76_9FIRM|nr:hypothetical protein [Mobilitalea sibirica]MBH1941737.1 hypothetical protein [Mobilitalea sibirica]
MEAVIFIFGYFYRSSDILCTTEENKGGQNKTKQSIGKHRKVKQRKDNNIKQSIGM